MPLLLFGLFVVVPAVELGLLIFIGEQIGLWATLGIILATGVLGAAMVKRQGLGVWREIRARLHEGHVPASALVDGAMILVAGAFLLTPGVLTDALGFALLVPGLRSLLRTQAKSRIEHNVARRVQVLRGHGRSGHDPDRDIIDV